MERITLINDFHNTSAIVVAKGTPLSISPRAMRKAESKLCGFSDCTCGKLRGHQERYPTREYSARTGKLMCVSFA